MPSRSFKDLTVWKRSLELAVEIYALTKWLPKSEEYALTGQLRRAAISIASNIAEGSKRGTHKDFSQFLRIAIGSAAEVETQLLIAGQVYPNLKVEKSLALLDEVQRMLAVLLTRIGTKN